MEITKNALAAKILFDGKRAIEVEFSHNCRAKHAVAQREAILSSSAITNDRFGLAALQQIWACSRSAEGRK